MKRFLPLLFTGALLPSLLAGSAVDRIKIEGNRTVVQPKFPDAKVENPWPQSYTDEYEKRVSEFGAYCKGKNNPATTGEHEKWGLPETFSSFIGGDFEGALAAMQAGDLEANRDHAHTLGYDFYWCFTLKGQAHKYFYYGEDFKKAYYEKMKEAAKLWTANDPRPSLELIGLLDAADAQSRKAIEGILQKMWRSPKEVKAMAEQAMGEGHPNKKRFGQYMLSIVDRLPVTMPSSTKEWTAWWRLIAAFSEANSWMIFEEYERRANPFPHPKYGIGSGPVGAQWNPGTRGMRADARNTDNLRGMREVAIYLFAEETGNEEVRRIYAEKIKASALKYLAVGNGEWDSEGYLAHTFAAYVNAYAFARDTQVRLHAKAILDYISLSAAKKYWRGAWGGPVKRDYGNQAPWAGSAAGFSIYFGDYPGKPHHERDSSLFINSGYRPPAAIVALAKRKFKRPVEIFSSHPTYEVMLPGNDAKPQYLETMYYGQTYQIGTLARGHGYDMNGFKVLTENSKTGADFFIPASNGGKTRNPVIDRGGSTNIGQLENMTIWLSQGAKGFTFLHPKTVAFEDHHGARVFKFEKTWIALHPVAMEFGGIKASSGKKGKSKNNPNQLLTAKPKGNHAGFVMVVGDAQSHGDFQGFLKSLKASKLELEGAKVTYTSAEGSTLAMEHQKGFPKLWRNGELHDWKSHWDLFQPADGSQVPCAMGWKDRKIHVEAGGHSFSAHLAEDGTYTFSNQLAP